MQWIDMEIFHYAIVPFISDYDIFLLRFLNRSTWVEFQHRVTNTTTMWPDVVKHTDVVLLRYIMKWCCIDDPISIVGIQGFDIHMNTHTSKYAQFLISHVHERFLTSREDCLCLLLLIGNNPSINRKPFIHQLRKMSKYHREMFILHTIRKIKPTYWSVYGNRIINALLMLIPHMKQFIIQYLTVLSMSKHQDRNTIIGQILNRL